MSDGGTGIGASELVDCVGLELDPVAAPEDAAEGAVLVWDAPPTTAPEASCEGCGALPSAPDAARAEPARASAAQQTMQQARLAGRRGITRA
ncbi:MAG TPA: hypothetical protein VK605_09510 [Solirubrobacteraceae bacterium]|nr:hypothetical protein [Solirubrobacteraceae bacterium]